MKQYWNKFLLIVICFCTSATLVFSQNIGINTTGGVPNTSAILDLNTGNAYASPNGKGLLIPNIALTSATDAITIGSPATSLLVYNTGTGGLAPAGYYYNSGTPALPVWTQLGGGSSASYVKDSAWLLKGNTGTLTTINYLGTTDSMALVIKTHNTRTGFIDIPSNGNIFFATGAGAGNTGLYNEAIGYQALTSNNTGQQNIALGNSALYSNTSGNQNTAVGQYSLFKNTTGYGNVSLGDMVMYNTTTAFSNIGIGTQALYNQQSANPSFPTTGSNNIGIGTLAMYGGALGFQSLYNIGIGYFALESDMGTTGNVAVGGYAMSLFGVSGNYNTALGYYALYAPQAGTNNTALGYNAMAESNASTSSYNTAVGANTIWHYYNLCNYNTALGDSAMYGNASAGGNGSQYNVAVGVNALAGAGGGAPILGNNNVAIGYKAIYGNTSAISGNNNIGIGFKSLFNTTSGINNIGIGSSALYTNTIGSSNTANGYQALYHSKGDRNTATGDSALYNNNTGNSNVANGFRTLNSNTNGSSNTAVGDSALYNNTTGSYNTAVGFGAGIPLAATYTNTTAIGNGAQVGASNTIQLGNNSVLLTKTAGQISVGGAGAGGNQGYLWGGGIAGPLNFCGVSCNCYPSTTAVWNQTAAAYAATFQFVNDGFYVLQSTTNTIGANAPSLSALVILSASGGPNSGKVGINKGAPAFQLDVNGTTACTGNVWTSDIRKKKDIETLNINALDIIGKLHPVTFKWKNVIDDGMKGTQMGFIAQELEKVVPAMVVTANDSIQSKSVKYAELFPIVVKAIQEQSQIIDSLKAANDKLQSEQKEMKAVNTNLQTEILALSAKMDTLILQVKNVVTPEATSSAKK